ncbi:MAG: histidine kinase, partial [Chloroflexi bacterium]|nr:histidine kinase [Chloroflexota bacterium]MCI0862958.1 histidine kinase [Chloroflexota bacterium]MCI0899923.1 histidine kinase [Chloroflexota bacterium]
GSVEIVISDTGSGIDPKNIDRIFDPLYSEKFNGTGLGLAICQEIINKHNGSISVESKVGTGTSFTIRIPLAVQDGRESEKPALV